jgi:CubicO group peptidase (beta-lactamase class C family)
VTKSTWGAPASASNKAPALKLRESTARSPAGAGPQPGPLFRCFAGWRRSLRRVTLILHAQIFSLCLDSAGRIAGQAAGRCRDGPGPGRLKLIPVRLRELVENQTIAGAVALVARHGEIASLDAVGWRDIEGGKPMTTDSIFQIMSMTKQFTGVAP